MILTTITIVVLAALAVETAAQPIPVPTPVAKPSTEADPWCLFNGNGCWKRDTSPGDLPWCLFREEGCWKEKREDETTTTAAAVTADADTVLEPQPEADAEANPWYLFEGGGSEDEKEGEGHEEKRSRITITTTAATAADADLERVWCHFRGQGCWKVKRAADAFANAIHAADGSDSGTRQSSRTTAAATAAEISNMDGGAAYNVKRAIEEIGNALAGRTDSPTRFLSKKLDIQKRFHTDSHLTISSSGNSSDVKKGEEKVENKEEDEEARNTRRWCLFRGEGCWKRDAAPWCLLGEEEGCWKRSIPMEEHEATADPWCLFQGKGCWKRTSETVATTATTPTTTTTTTTTTNLEARDAALAFCPFDGEAGNICYSSRQDFITADKRACNQPGEACDIARRATEALIGEIENWQQQQQHLPPSPSPSKRDPNHEVEARWCLLRGEGCWKRDNMDEVVARCEAEDGPCHQARLDLTAIHTAARNLLEYIS